MCTRGQSKRERERERGDRKTSRCPLGERYRETGQKFVRERMAGRRERVREKKRKREGEGVGITAQVGAHDVWVGLATTIPYRRPAATEGTGCVARERGTSKRRRRRRKLDSSRTALCTHYEQRAERGRGLGPADPDQLAGGLGLFH